MKDLETFLSHSYNYSIEQSLEELVKYLFPEIKNLKVETLKDDTLNISFDGGIYTQEEVKLKVDEFMIKSKI